jgi:hypothetical protein
MAQRGLSPEDIGYVCDHGRPYYRAGMVHYFLGKKDIPPEDGCNADVQRLVGTTVLMENEDLSLIVTVYRNQNAIRRIRRKPKYHSRKNIYQ